MHGNGTKRIRALASRIAVRWLVRACGFMGLAVVDRALFDAATGTIKDTASELDAYVSVSGAIAQAGRARPKAIKRVRAACEVLSNYCTVMRTLPLS